MRIELFAYDASLRVPIAGAAQRHETRRHLLLRLTHGGIEGWGEISPQPDELNGDPSVDMVLDELRTIVVPSFIRVVKRESSAPHWFRISRFQGSRPASAPAQTLVEMALLDWTLHRDSAHIRTVWPERYATPTQSTVGINGGAVDATGSFGRVRVKVDEEPLDDAVLSFLATVGVPVILDYNCCEPSLTSVRHHLSQAATVAEIAAIEQPFRVGNLVDTALLRNELSCGVSLDESVRSIRDITHIARYGAASMICIKPSRVGGLSVARACVDAADKLGIEAYIGGFFELSLGRAANRAVAMTSTLSPSDIGPVDFADADGLWESTTTGFGLTPAASLREQLNPIVSCDIAGVSE